MQEILAARDRLRAEIEGLDGGYKTVAKLLNQSDVSVILALKPENTPRLKTLEKIKEAVKKAKISQDIRLATLNG